MNKRIIELADQILPNEKEFHKGDPNEWGFFFSGKELENFAELIVRECVEQGILVQSQTVTNGSEEYVAGRAMGIEVYMNQIRKHFGVE